MHIFFVVKKNKIQEQQQQKKNNTAHTLCESHKSKELRKQKEIQ